MYELVNSWQSVSTRMRKQTHSFKVRKRLHSRSGSLKSAKQFATKCIRYRVDRKTSRLFQPLLPLSWCNRDFVIKPAIRTTRGEMNRNSLTLSIRASVEFSEVRRIFLKTSQKFENFPCFHFSNIKWPISKQQSSHDSGKIFSWKCFQKYVDRKTVAGCEKLILAALFWDSRKNIWLRLVAPHAHSFWQTQVNKPLSVEFSLNEIHHPIESN